MKQIKCVYIEMFVINVDMQVVQGGSGKADKGVNKTSMVR